MKAPSPIRQLAIDSEGVLFAATPHGIHSSNDLGKSQRACRGPGLLTGSLTGPAWVIDGQWVPHGELWLGQRKQGLSFYSAGRPDRPMLQPSYPISYGRFRSKDSGASWEAITQTLDPVAIAFDKQGRPLVGGQQSPPEQP